MAIGEQEKGWASGLLSAQPVQRGDIVRTITAGLHRPLGDDHRSPVLFVPKTLPDRPAGLIVLLHGAGGNSTDILPILRDEAERLGVLVLVPQSAGSTWDMLLRNYGPDVGTIDRALAKVFELCPIDPRRIAVSGFSDGGSYALSLGVGNGNLFSGILAFSPGFIQPGEQRGEPEIFISHGTNDGVLPIDRCSRRIVPALERAGYRVDYREFNGGHVVPVDMVKAAMDGLDWA